MLRLSAVTAALLVSSSSLAAHVYQVSRQTVRTEAIEAMSSLEIVDSIPQLGIVVTRTTLAGDKAAHARLHDLGEVGRVHLIAPLLQIATEPAVPSTMWGLKAIHLAAAWKISKGDGVTVAVSDTGVNATHKELATQMWRNPGESGVDSKGHARESNKIDDDGNGYVDDVYGWDFVKNQPGGVDHHYHGTHVAGTIAAVATKQMAGVAPHAKIMDVSFLNSDGSGDDVSAAKTLVYAVDKGAKIINCSWGGDETNLVLEKAIQYAQAHGALVIAAAGNDGANNDKHTFTPSGYDYENIVSVGATSTASGSRASFSNYGLKTVDLAAPGDKIYSLAPGNSHQELSGTSMATPHVAGVAALVWSAHPQYSASQVKKALMTTAPASSWKNKSITGGMLEADLAVTH